MIVYIPCVLKELCSFLWKLLDSAVLHAKWLQFCLTLHDPMDCSPPGSSAHGILQPRILEWVAVPSSRGSSRPKDRTCVSCVGRMGTLPLVPPGKFYPSLNYHFFPFFFHWKINALQYCASFCHMSTWIRHRDTYVPSLLNLPPISRPVPPL